MELLLFRNLCLVVGGVSLLVVLPSNFLHHISFQADAVVLLFSLAALCLYGEACRERYHTLAFFFLCLSALAAVWFPNGGSLGCVGLFFLPLFCYVLIFFRGCLRWFLFVVALAGGIGLFAAEHRFPQWVTSYATAADRFADLAIGLVVSGLYSSVMLWAVLTRHDREQLRLNALNAALRRSVARRRRAEARLSRNRQLLHAVFEGASDAIYAKDRQGRYLIFNRAAAEMTGRSAAEVLGADDTALFSAAEAREVMRVDAEVLADGVTCTLEKQLNVAAGRRFVQSTKGPLRDERGEVIGVFGISRDVTESRRLADELRQLNAELELRVQERTARLETAVREQEAFSNSVSHDLRGPLRHINSYASILEEELAGALTPEARGCLERIRHASSGMRALIDDLLELSRIGSSELSKVPVDLSELAAALSGQLREEAPQRRVEFVIEPGLTVLGDRVLLRQMLENLLGNAWKYSSRRERAVIEVGRGRVGEAYFVRDNGVGFDMAYRERLFVAFQRLHGAEFEGSGIGLATVKRIVERHGGSIWAEAAVDQGATIFFTLP